ncbi:hypothetical protein E4U54_003523, partial [Claviceps lovelessii]
MCRCLYSSADTPVPVLLAGAAYDPPPTWAGITRGDDEAWRDAARDTDTQKLHVHALSTQSPSTHDARQRFARPGWSRPRRQAVVVSLQHRSIRTSTTSHIVSWSVDVVAARPLAAQ